jgi:hypothetical protein
MIVLTAEIMSRAQRSLKQMDSYTSKSPFADTAEDLEGDFPMAALFWRRCFSTDGINDTHTITTDD